MAKLSVLPVDNTIVFVYIHQFGSFLGKLVPSCIN